MPGARWSSQVVLPLVYHRD